MNSDTGQSETATTTSTSDYTISGLTSANSSHLVRENPDGNFSKKGTYQTAGLPETLIHVASPESSINEHPLATATAILHPNNASHDLDLMNTKKRVSVISEGSDDESKDRSLRYGWCGFRPNFLQKFNSPVAMLVFISLLVIVQAKLVSGFLNTSLSTIEKVFGLSSTESGIIISTYDAASLLAVIPVTYFGQSGRKPRYLGGGALLIAVGCFVFFLPEAFRDAYDWVTEEESLQYCSNAAKQHECLDYSSNQKLRFIFMAGTLLIGIGATPVYTLGVAYMDENVPKARSALYLGVFYTVAVAAPAVGYVLSGAFLRIPIDFKHWGANMSDPSWAGAWFIGFLLQAVLAFLIAIPLLGLPKKIKGSEDIQRVNELPNPNQLESEKVPVSTEETKPSGLKRFRKAAKNLPKSLLSLIKNSTYMLLISHGVCSYLVISGMATFLPKYFESQFTLSSSDSAFVVGSLAIPAAAIGTLSSGVFLKYKDWSCHKVMKFALAIQLLAIPFLSFFLLSCAKNNLVGLHVSYETFEKFRQDDSKFSFDAPCNQQCFCDYVYYDPICAANDVSYFSPCHSGCYNVEVDKALILSQAAACDGLIYSVNYKGQNSGMQEELKDCKCLSINTTVTGSNGVATVVSSYLEASKKMCSEGCPIRSLSFVLFFLMLLVASMISVPHITCILRVVPEGQRSLALGLQWVFVRLLGTIPGPIIVGRIFDNACLLWNESKACHTSGFCLTYMMKNLGLYCFLYSIIPMASGVLFLLCAIRSYKQPKVSTIDDEASNSLNEALSPPKELLQSSLEIKVQAPAIHLKLPPDGDGRRIPGKNEDTFYASSLITSKKDKVQFVKNTAVADHS